MIKPIETKYKGRRFRSRLEARWAIFFDECGIKWDYEPEGFDLGNGVKYLPDFLLTFLNGQKLWAEVKPDGGDISKPIMFSGASRQRIIILEGQPALAWYKIVNNENNVYQEDYMKNYEIKEYFFHPLIRYDKLFITTGVGTIYPWWDDRYEFCYRALSQELLHRNKTNKERDTSELHEIAQLINQGYQIVENAVQASLSARFEFGENQ